MFGNNPKRPPVRSDGKTLEVQEIFPTVQGEGPNVGEPSVFIRLGGCNLACTFCDTEFESYESLRTDDAIEEIKKLALNNKNKRIRNLVVITGGEPFRQPIEYLCQRLLDEGFAVQIETNGTIFRDINKEVQIVCSPKNTGNGYGKIRPDLLERIDAFKFIISAHDKEYADIADVGQGEYDIPVYVQPMDEQDEKKNRENIELVKRLSFENGYRISIQTHKVLAVR